MLSVPLQPVHNDAGCPTLSSTNTLAHMPPHSPSVNRNCEKVNPIPALPEGSGAQPPRSPPSPAPPPHFPKASSASARHRSTPSPTLPSYLNCPKASSASARYRSASSAEMRPALSCRVMDTYIIEGEGG